MNSAEKKNDKQSLSKKMGHTTSFVLVSADSEWGMNEAQKLCADRGISRFDITIITHEEIKKSDTKTSKSIGIEDIKKIQEKMYLKPFQSTAKAIIIPHSHLLTIPAQNALLKLLEEPPKDTYILLLVDSKTTLLPTILSRCKIIEFESSLTTPNEAQTQLTDTIIAALDQIPIGQALTVAELLAKNKDEAIYSLEQAILRLREKMVYTSTNDEMLPLARTVKKMQRCLTDLKMTNTNPRLLLEALFLSFV